MKKLFMIGTVVAALGTPMLCMGASKKQKDQTIVKNFIAEIKAAQANFDEKRAQAIKEKAYAIIPALEYLDDAEKAIALSQIDDLMRFFKPVPTKTQKEQKREGAGKPAGGAAKPSQPEAKEEGDLARKIAEQKAIIDEYRTKIRAALLARKDAEAVLTADMAIDLIRMLNLLSAKERDDAIAEINNMIAPIQARFAQEAKDIAAKERQRSVIIFYKYKIKEAISSGRYAEALQKADMAILEIRMLNLLSAQERDDAIAEIKKMVAFAQERLAQEVPEMPSTPRSAKPSQGEAHECAEMPIQPIQREKVEEQPKPEEVILSNEYLAAKKTLLDAFARLKLELGSLAQENPNVLDKKIRKMESKLQGQAAKIRKAKDDAIELTDIERIYLYRPTLANEIDTLKKQAAALAKSAGERNDLLNTVNQQEKEIVDYALKLSPLVKNYLVKFGYWMKVKTDIFGKTE